MCVVRARCLSKLCMLACACWLHTCARTNVLLFFNFFYFVASVCVLAVRACFSPRACVRMCDLRACCLSKLGMPACACWLRAHVRARQCSFIVFFYYSILCFFFISLRVSVCSLCVRASVHVRVNVFAMCVCAVWALHARVAVCAEYPRARSLISFYYLLFFYFDCCVLVLFSFLFRCECLCAICACVILVRVRVYACVRVLSVLCMPACVMTVRVRARQCSFIIFVFVLFCFRFILLWVSVFSLYVRAACPRVFSTCVLACCLLSILVCPRACWLTACVRAIILYFIFLFQFSLILIVVFYCCFLFFSTHYVLTVRACCICTYKSVCVRARDVCVFGRGGGVRVRACVCECKG